MRNPANGSPFEGIQVWMWILTAVMKKCKALMVILDRSEDGSVNLLRLKPSDIGRLSPSKRSDKAILEVGSVGCRKFMVVFAGMS